MALSALFFSLMSLFVKLAGSRFPVSELVFARAVVVAFLAGGVIAVRRTPLRSPHWRLLVLRGVVGLLALACFYFSVIHLPLAEATVIHFTNPVFTALIAAVVLGEGVRGRELALASVSLVGVVVMVRPGVSGLTASAGLDPLAAASGLTAAMLAALAYVLVRRVRAVDAMVIVFYFAAVSVLAMAPLLPSFAIPQGRDWLLLLAVGVSTFLGQVFVTLGLQRERAGRATAVGYLQIVFASLWGALVFDHMPGPWTLVGGAMIVGTTLLLARSRIA